MHRVLFMSFSESASIFFNSNALHTRGLLVTLQHKLWLSVFSGHHFKRNIKHRIPGLEHKTMSMQCCRIVRKAASRDEWLLWEMPSNAASVQSRSSFLTNQKQLSQKKRWPARNVFLLLFFFFPRIPPATRAYFEIWLFCMYCDWQDYYFAKNCCKLNVLSTEGSWSRILAKFSH